MKSKTVIAACVIAAAAILAVGVGLGMQMSGRRASGNLRAESQMVSKTVAAASSEQLGCCSSSTDQDAHDHVDISATAAKNLGVRFEPVALQTFRKHLHIPGVVIEKPGQSGLAVTTPIQGIVRQIHKFPGQAISVGDPLFTLQVADEALESAQLSLLEILTRISVADGEIARLDPLTETGAIVGRRKLELEYQRKQYRSELAARLQELRLRGLSSAQVDSIVQDRELVGEIVIHLDIAGDDVQTSGEEAIDETGPIFTVEQLNVFPGRSVRKGEELCHVANHHELFLRGEAFEADVSAIRQLSEKGWTIEGEFGDGDDRIRQSGLRITYMDNHVDSATQTFPFYLSLQNRVVAEYHDAAGRLFRSWQFKPGQRAHLRVPVQEWADQIVLPRDAVVRSGPDAFVFRLEDPAHELPPEKRRPTSDTIAMRMASLDHMPTFELEPIPVHVLHQDGDQVVIAAGDELQLGDIVAMNRAYQLHLAWRLQMSSGVGGHDHDH